MPACFITQAEKRIIMSYSVAIDGPAGAGKSTIAKLISKQMGYIYVSAILQDVGFRMSAVR